MLRENYTKFSTFSTFLLELGLSFSWTLSKYFSLQKGIFLFGLIGLFSPSLFSQIEQSDYSFVKTKEGFSKRGITTITADHQGFIWIGTYGAGLHRYDGVGYTSFHHDWKDSTSINSNIINAVFQDKSNRIWVGSDGGLNLYDRALSRFSTIEFEYTRDSNEKNLSIVAITEGGNGEIFLGTKHYGLFLIPANSLVAIQVPTAFVQKEGIPLDINDFATSSSGVLYAASQQGLKFYDAQKGTINSARMLTEQGEVTLDYPLNKLFIDDLNNLWIGSQYKGVYKTSCLNAKKLTLKNLEHFPLTEKRILSLAQDKEGHIFCGTENDGLFILDSEGKTIKILLHDKNRVDGLKSNSIWSVFFDTEDRLWIGYYDKGVDVYDPLHNKFSRIEGLPNDSNTLKNGSVTGMVEDQAGNIWISMDGGGLDYYDKSNKNFNHFLSPQNKDYQGKYGAAAQTVFIDRQQNLWVGSWDEGIFLRKKGQKEFIQYTKENTNSQLISNRILSIAEDSKGMIWFGTFGKGLNSFDPKTETFQYYDDPELAKYGIPNYDLRKILIDEKDQIWIGSTKGLFKIVFTGDQMSEVISFRDRWLEESNEHVSLNKILCIFEASNGDIWIGTDGAGICRYQIEQDLFSWYNEGNGFNQQTVSAIIEGESGQIWASGRSGLSSIDLANKEIRKYSKEDGLISDDFNNNAVLKDKNGLLYFGNVMGGINYFSPDSIPTNKSKIRVYLSNLKLFNKTVSTQEEDTPLNKVLSETESITLNYRQSVFTIEYTGISFTRAEENQFAYYLEGLEDSWNYVGNSRSATYTSLQSGDYVFKVKAANNDGLWNEEPVTLKIKVLPPWWKSNTGFVIYILLFLATLYVFFRIMRMRVLARKERENERQVRQQEEELNKKKFQFFTNISHEFRTPLTLILNPLEDILNDHTNDLPDEVHSKHLIIHKNSKRLERLINELMDFRKLNFNKMKVRARKTEVVRFIDSVAEYFKGEAIDKDIELIVTPHIPSQYAWIDSGLIEKVLFNLLSNAFKVTTAGGRIQIDIATDEKIFTAIDEKEKKPAISIAVSDTGPGLSPDHIHHIFERFYQVENLNKSYYGGTGIGLEVVNNFIRLHKGEIKVESELGIGTTFTISLPLGENHFADSELSSKAPMQEVAKQQMGEDTKLLNEEFPSQEKVKTLLIVEDNTELRNYLKSELQKTYQIRAAADGVEGLNTAIKVLPDLIITDVMMPEMDGFELCKKIKEDIRTCHIPLLMLTAKSNAADQVQGIDLGADAFIGKPFDMPLLKAKLHQLLTSRQIIFNKYFSGISESKINKNTTSLDKDFIHTVLSFIHKRIGDSNLNVESLAAEVFLSRSQLYRKIKALTGHSVNEFIRRVRLEEAKKLIQKGNVNIAEVCYAVGFSSPSYFSKCFKEHFGQLPTEVVHGNPNQT